MTEAAMRAAVTILERRGMTRDQAWTKVRVEGLSPYGMATAERRRRRTVRLKRRAELRELESAGLCTDCETRPRGEASRCRRCAAKRAARRRKHPTS